MKRILLLSLASILLSGAAFAQGSPFGYIGLFNDVDHSVWCTEVGCYMIEMWIWCLPSERGQIGADFMIRYPANVVQGTVMWNEPIISLAIGDLPTGLSLNFGTCQWDWLWICHQVIYVTDPMPSYVEVCAHPIAGPYRFVNCLPGYPTEPCRKLNNLYINYEPSASSECQVLGYRDTSWGAIKNFYR